MTYSAEFFRTCIFDYSMPCLGANMMATLTTTLD